MQRGISYQGFLPLREEPSNWSGMLSQLLFGESFNIVEAQGAWLRIKTDSEGSEGSEGWISRKSIQPTEEAVRRKNGPGTNDLMVIHPVLSVLDTRNASPLLLPAGSILRTSDKERFKKLTDDGWISPGPESDLEECGERLLSIPGLQGGRCGFGFDAPGLVQLLCRSMGISLPHSISGQAEMGTIINFVHEAQKGDLAFFHDGEEHFTHVGMVFGGGRIIHATDQVRMDKLDQQGIYCTEKQGYTHQLRVIKSIK
jgi:gamma-D-glutamyl-L-lysine dipeptidyl-peptidase